MKIAALAGGVGGAKLAEGLQQALPAADLTVIVNIGDDFEHLVFEDLSGLGYRLLHACRQSQSSCGLGARRRELAHS